MAISKLLGKKDVAELLGKSENAVSYMISTGKLPRPLRLGRKVVWREETIDAWMTENLVEDDNLPVQNFGSVKQPFRPVTSSSCQGKEDGAE